jgi:hypothetical protein
MMMIFEGTKSTITAGWELMKSKTTTLCVRQFFFVGFNGDFSYKIFLENNNWSSKNKNNKG